MLTSVEPLKRTNPKEPNIKYKVFCRSCILQTGMKDTPIISIIPPCVVLLSMKGTRRVNGGTRTAISEGRLSVKPMEVRTELNNSTYMNVRLRMILTKYCLHFEY